MRRFDLFDRIEDDGLTLLVARSWRARLLGLAFLDELPHRHALLIPGCRSVHTFGMRFSLDLLWLDHDASVLRADRDVRPGRVRGCATACAVLELPPASRELRPAARAGS